MTEEYTPGPSPELEQVEQRDSLDDSRLYVCVDEVKPPVRVHQLPARLAVMQSRTVTTDTQKLFPEDLRRARVLLWAHADTPQAVYLGTRADEVYSGTSAQLLALDTDGTQGAPHTLELLNTEAVYARAATDTVTISYLLEQWAD